jgi:hypothetical protein
MADFLQPVIDLIMTPGSSLTLVPVINVTVLLLLVLMGCLLYSKIGTIHILIMSSLAVGLLISVNWYVWLCCWLAVWLAVLLASWLAGCAAGCCFGLVCPHSPFPTHLHPSPSSLQPFPPSLSLSIFYRNHYSISISISVSISVSSISISTDCLSHTHLLPPTNLLHLISSSHLSLFLSLAFSSHLLASHLSRFPSPPFSSHLFPSRRFVYEFQKVTAAEALKKDQKSD